MPDIFSEFHQYARELNIPLAEVGLHFAPRWSNLAAAWPPTGSKWPATSPAWPRPIRCDLDDAQFLAEVADEVTDPATSSQFLDAALVIAHRAAGEIVE